MSEALLLVQSFNRFFYTHALHPVILVHVPLIIVLLALLVIQLLHHLMEFLNAIVPLANLQILLLREVRHPSVASKRLVDEYGLLTQQRVTMVEVAPNVQSGEVLVLFLWFQVLGAATGIKTQVIVIHDPKPAIIV